MHCISKIWSITGVPIAARPILTSPPLVILKQQRLNVSLLYNLLNPTRSVKSKMKKLRGFDRETVWDLLKSYKGNWGREIAYECAVSGFKLTFDDVYTLAESFGASLYHSGLRKGDVVTIILPNCPQYAAVLVGMLATGIVASPIDVDVPLERQRIMMNIIKPKALVTFPENLATALQLKKQTSVEAIVLVGRPKKGFLNFIEMIETVPYGTEFVNGREIQTGDEVALITWSTGLTSNGEPRAIALTHRNLVAQALQLTQKKASLCRRGVETFIGLTPVSYSNSTVLCIIVSLLIGAKVITLPAFNPRLFVKAMKDHKPTCLHLFPPQFQFLLLHPAIKARHFADCHTIMCNGAIMPNPSLVGALLRKADKEIFFQGAYGMPEVPFCFMMDPKGKKLNSVGRPVANTVAKVFDVSTGASLGPNEEGEICVKGPQIMKGYWNENLVSGSATELMPGNWFHTGDIGYYDEKKYFYVTEHKNDLIVGYDAVVWPNRIEGIVREMDGVQDCTVLGVPRGFIGHIPRVYIVKRNPFLGEEEVLSYLKSSEKLRIYQDFELEIAFVQHIPRSYTGRVIRSALPQDSSEKV